MQALYDHSSPQLEKMGYFTRPHRSPSPYKGPAVFEDDHGACWEPVDPLGSVVISGTLIPKPQLSQDGGVMARFLSDSSHPFQWTHSDSVGLAYDPGMRPAAGPGAFGSPAQSSADDQSMIDFHSSSAVYSDMLSGSRSIPTDPQQFYDVERSGEFGHPVVHTGSYEVMNLALYRNAIHQGGGSTSSCVDPREVQPSEASSGPEYGDGDGHPAPPCPGFGQTVSAQGGMPTQEMAMLSPYALMRQDDGPYTASPARAMDGASDDQVGPPPAKRHRRGDSQSSASTSSLEDIPEPNKCLDHPELSFPTSEEWSAHLEQEHKQPFTCLFARYGCTSTFRSKNEWKRHINCSHLQLSLWRCDMDACASQSSRRRKGSGSRSNDFNRKDLFQQHLRRLHADAFKESEQRSSSSTDNNGGGGGNPGSGEGSSSGLAAPIHERCCVVNRHPPQRGVCGCCDKVFEGHGCWDDYLEHVGKHYEKRDHVRLAWRDDDGLREYLRQEGLLEYRPSAGWVMVSRSKKRKSRSQEGDEGEEARFGE